MEEDIEAQIKILAIVILLIIERGMFPKSACYWTLSFVLPYLKSVMKTVTANFSARLHGFRGSLDYRWQIVKFLSLHNYVSQFIK
jgi:hypothetical protein